MHFKKKLPICGHVFHCIKKLPICRHVFHCINEQKTQFPKNKIAFLGYRVTNQTIKSDRVQPLLKMLIPKTPKELQQLNRPFAYYLPWIPNYSNHIQPVVGIIWYLHINFLLSSDIVAAIEKLKQILASLTLYPNQ